MAIRSRILPAGGLVITQAYGSFTWADLRRHRSLVADNPRYQRSLALLFDVRRVTALELNAEQIRDHAGGGNAGEARFSHIAILVASDLTFGLARIFQAYSSHRYGEHALRVFRDAAQASRWVTEKPGP